MSKLEDTD